MKVPRCKGTQDMPPAEMAKFRRVESAFQDACLKWGYDEVRTPTLEYLHLFTSAGTLTPGMLHKVYSFLDWDGWSGERVVLRPDATIPVARFYVDCMGDREAAKLSYVANVFRFEGTGTEARERWQCGAEHIGPGSPAADVELIVLALDVLRLLGITDAEVTLSHAGLIREVLTRLGLSAAEQVKLFDRNGGALADLERSAGLNGNLAALLGMKGKSSGMLKNLKTLVAPGMPDLVPALDNFIAIVDLVDSLGFKYQVDIDSGRGFEYYTGMIFQLFAGGGKVGGGGRYDALIPVLGGRNVPASGFALYADRLMALMSPQEKGQARKVVIRAESSAITQAFNTAESLHRAGYKAELDYGKNSLVPVPASFTPEMLQVMDILMGRDSCDDNDWLLSVQSDHPVFVLLDFAQNKTYTASSLDEVIAIIGGQSGKNRPA